MSDNTAEIPSVQIQHDWQLSFLEKDKFWILFSFKDEKKHGEIFVPNNTSSPLRATPDSFQVIEKSLLSLDVKYTRTKPPTKIRFTRSISDFRNIHEKNPPIEGLDISPEGGLGVSGSRDGSLKVWNTQNGSVFRSFRGHIGDINVCRFLPSGKVIISGSSDFQIKIWRVHDSLCAVTLRGHHGGVNSLSFIDRGRNFVSCGNDGKVILWDCASQSQITDLFRNTSKKRINEVSSIQSSDFGSKEEAKSPKEFNTENHIVSFCSDDGKLCVVDIRSRKIVLDKRGFGQALNSCCFFGDESIVVGGQNGDVNCFDLRFHQDPKYSYNLGNVVINNVQRFDESNLLVGMQDGQCLKFDFRNKRIVESFTGSDLDPIYGTRLNGKFLYTCCRDSRIRKYNIYNQ